MILRIFRRTRDPQVGDYLTGETDGNGKIRTAEPVILSGNKDAFEPWRSLCPFKDQYFSSAISWSENMQEVGINKIKETAQSCIDLLCDDHSITEFPHLVVLHRRKRGCDLHIALGREHLSRGCYFPHYRDTINEIKLNRAWRRKINLKNGWSDPEDPWRKRLVKPAPSFLRGEKRELYDYLNLINVREVVCAFALNRDDLINGMERDGYIVTPQTDYLQVQSGDLTVKLYGSIYHAGAKCFPLAYDPRIKSEYTPEYRAAEIKRMGAIIHECAAIRTLELSRFRKTNTFRFPPRISSELLSIKDIKQEVHQEVENLGTFKTLPSKETTNLHEEHPISRSLIPIIAKNGSELIKHEGSAREMLNFITLRHRAVSGLIKKNYCIGEPPKFNPIDITNRKAVSGTDAVPNCEQSTIQLFTRLVNEIGSAIKSIGNHELVRPRSGMLPLPSAPQAKEIHKHQAEFN